MKFNILLLIMMIAATTTVTAFLNDETHILFGGGGGGGGGGGSNESVVESYIFDNDNTGSLTTTGDLFSTGVYAQLFNASQFFSSTLTLQRIGASSYLYAQPHPFLEQFVFGHFDGINMARFLFDAANNKIALSSGTKLCDDGFTNCGTMANFLTDNVGNGRPINQWVNTTSNVTHNIQFLQKLSVKNKANVSNNGTHSIYT